MRKVREDLGHRKPVGFRLPAGVVVRESADQTAHDRGRLFQQVETIESIIFGHAIDPNDILPSTCRTEPAKLSFLQWTTLSPRIAPLSRHNTSIFAPAFTSGPSSQRVGVIHGREFSKCGYQAVDIIKVVEDVD